MADFIPSPMVLKLTSDSALAATWAASDLSLSILMSLRSIPMSAEIAKAASTLWVLCISRNVMMAAVAPSTVTATPGSGGINQNQRQQMATTQMMAGEMTGLAHTALNQDSMASNLRGLGQG